MAGLAIALALVVGVLAVGVVYAFEQMYGDLETSGAWQGLQFGLGAVVAVAVLATAAGLLLRSRVGVAVAVALVLLTASGVAVAGDWGVRAKAARMAVQNRVPTCLMTAEDGASPADVTSTRRLQDAFDALDHPAPFGGGASSGVFCESALQTRDWPRAADFYRRELPASGWDLTSDTPQRLVAVSGDLTLTVAHSDGEIAVRIDLESE